MKAIIFEKFGSSSNLKLEDISIPDLRSGEVRIRILYTSVNPVDWKIREGYLDDVLPHKFPITCGWDAAGEIIAIADNVSGYKVGDKVMAYTRLPEVGVGTYAEYINLPESYLAPVPTSIDLASAAALPLVSLTAYQALHDVMKIKQGHRLLVTAGAGGVGSMAIQFAKLVGAEVTATSQKGKHGYLHELGADHVVDYTAADVAQQLRAAAPTGFDLVCDCAGGASLEQVWNHIVKSGTLVSIAEAPVSVKAGRPDVTSSYHFVAPNGVQLAAIAGLIDAGRVRLPKIHVRSVKEAAAAQDENQGRRVQGKVVLKIDF